MHRHQLLAHLTDRADTTHAVAHLDGANLTLNQVAIDDNLFEQIYCKIKFSGLPKVRWFDSGDIADAEFFERMIDLCKRTPEAKHMAFTKKYEIVNNWIAKNGPLPENLNILFSAWDKMWEVPNPHGLGMAYVDFNEKRLNPEFPKNIFVCPGRASTCSACGACWSKKLKAVAFHQH